MIDGKGPLEDPEGNACVGVLAVLAGQLLAGGYRGAFLHSGGDWKWNKELWSLVELLTGLAAGGTVPHHPDALPDDRVAHHQMDGLH